MKTKWIEAYSKFQNLQVEKITKLTIRIKNLEQMVEYLAAKVFKDEN